MPRRDAAAYPSLTKLGGTRVIWYPDRKHFLLGKIVSDTWLADMAVLGPPRPVNTRYAKAVKRDRPLAYWCFDDQLSTPGAIASDETGRHHGTYQGRVTLVPGAAGVGGTAAAFDGRKSCVRASGPPAFGRGIQKGTTIEFWLRTTTQTPARQLMGALNADGTACVVDVNRDAELEAAVGKTSFFLRDADKKCLSGDVTTDLYDGKWHHLAWVIRAPAENHMEVYIDGKRDASLTLRRRQAPSRFTHFSVPWIIGAANNRGAVVRHTQAEVDELAIYDRALEAGRIAAHYGAALSPRPANRKR
jgi:hypothetical protein